MFQLDVFWSVMHRTALEVRESSLLDASGPRLKASSVTIIRSSAREEEEEASGEDFDGASPPAATSNAPFSSVLTTPHPGPAATPPTCSPSSLRTDEPSLTRAASFAESHGLRQTEGGGHSTVDGAKGPIGILGAVDVSGVQTENTDSQGGRNDMDCRIDVSQSGSGGVDDMDVDRSGKGADLGITAGQRDGQGHTVGVENGRTRAGGVGTDLNQNGSDVCFDQSGGAEGQGADATGGGGVGRTGLDQNGSGVDHDMNLNQSGKGADGGMCTDAEGSGRFPETGAKNSEADGIDQSISGAAHVDKDGSEEDQGMDVDGGSGRGTVDVEQNGSGLDRGAHAVGHQGDKVKGGGGDGGGGDLDQSSSEDDQDESTSSSSQAEDSPDAEDSPEAKDSSTRKRKTPPPPEPANKGGK